jgi:hypothetical protein
MVSHRLVAGEAESANQPALNPLLALQRALGNQAVQRALTRAAIPAPLILGRQPALGHQQSLRLLAGVAPPAPADRPHQARRSCASGLGSILAPTATVLRSGEPAHRPAADPAGPLQRQLTVTAAKDQQDVETFLDLLRSATKLPLDWNPKTGAVTLAQAAEEPARGGLAGYLRRIVRDEKHTARVVVGRGLRDVAIGDFPLNTWDKNNEPDDRAQQINLDNIEAIERGVKGIGVAMGIHEVYENYVAQQHGDRPAREAKAIGHQAGVELESIAADELAGAGKRLSEEIDIVGAPAILSKGRPGFDATLFDGRQYLVYPSRIRYEKKWILFDQYEQQSSGQWKLANVRSVPPQESAGSTEASLEAGEGHQSRSKPREGERCIVC